MSNESDWSDGYWTEGADRIHNVIKIIELMLDGHPAILKAGLQGRVHLLCGILGEMYQEIPFIEETSSYADVSEEEESRIEDCVDGGRISFTEGWEKDDE